jgi:hypothetical protein
MDRVDVEALTERIDVDELVQKTELGSIIARSTTGVLSEGLDLIRSQGVGLDDFSNRWVNRILRRKGELPVGPPLLTGTAGALSAGPLTIEATAEPPA